MNVALVDYIDMFEFDGVWYAKDELENLIAREKEVDRGHTERDRGVLEAIGIYAGRRSRAEGQG